MLNPVARIIKQILEPHRNLVPRPADVFVGLPEMARPFPHIAEHPLMQFLDKYFIEYISGLRSIQPGSSLNDVVLFPPIQFAACCDMCKQKIFRLIGFDGGRSIGETELGHQSSHRFAGSVSISFSIMSARIFMFSSCVSDWPSRPMV